MYVKLMRTWSGVLNRYNGTCMYVATNKPACTFPEQFDICLSKIWLCKSYNSRTLVRRPPWLGNYLDVKTTLYFSHLGFNNLWSMATPSFTNVDTSLLWTFFVRPSSVHITEVLLYFFVKLELLYPFMGFKYGTISIMLSLTGPLY